MDKYIYDENNGLWYELVEDNYIPCLTLPLEENKPIGIWGGNGTCGILNSISVSFTPIY